MGCQKIAVLFRGPARPTVQSMAERIEAFVAHLQGFGIDPTVYLATWDMEDRAGFMSALNGVPVHNFLLFQDFTNEQILAITGVSAFGNGGPAFNAFRQYYMSRQALTVISQDSRFSHIIHTRTDMDITLGGALDLWINDRYCTIHTQDSHPGAFINDQFAIAPAALMAQAWDFQDYGTLATLFREADKPEDVLQGIIDRAGVHPEMVPIGQWRLDPHR